MTLVRDVCDFVYVLDFGSDLRRHPGGDARSDEVRAAYLGGALAAAGGLTTGFRRRPTTAPIPEGE